VHDGPVLSLTEMLDDHFRHDAPLARIAGEGLGVRAELC
jgi:hypothetical protein